MLNNTILRLLRWMMPKLSVEQTNERRLHANKSKDTRIVSQRTDANVHEHYKCVLISFIGHFVCLNKKKWCGLNMHGQTKIPFGVNHFRMATKQFMNAITCEWMLVFASTLNHFLHFDLLQNMCKFALYNTCKSSRNSRQMSCKCFGITITTMQWMSFNDINVFLLMGFHEIKLGNCFFHSFDAFGKTFYVLDEKETCEYGCNTRQDSRILDKYLRWCACNAYDHLI